MRERDNGTEQDFSDEGTPHLEGESENQPGEGDDVSTPRAQRRIESLAQTNRELREAMDRQALQLAEMRGRLDEVARRPSTPVREPEFDTEADRLEYMLKQQAKEMAELKKQMQSDKASRSVRQAIAAATKGLDFGDLSDDEERIFVSTPLQAALSEGKTPAEARRLAQVIARRLNPNKNGSRTTPATPSGKQYADAKAADAAATRRPKPASSEHASAETKVKSLEERKSEALAKMHAALGRHRQGATG